MGSETMPTDIEKQMDKATEVLDVVAASEKRRLWYLASPYSTNNESVMYARVQAADRVAGWLVKQGVPLFSPISMSHPMHEEVPQPWETWMNLDRDFFLPRTDGIIVNMLPGYNLSSGVNEEINFNAEQDRPIIYIDPMFLFTTKEWDTLCGGPNNKVGSVQTGWEQT